MIMIRELDSQIKANHQIQNLILSSLRDSPSKLQSGSQTKLRMVSSKLRAKVVVRSHSPSIFLRERWCSNSSKLTPESLPSTTDIVLSQLSKSISMNTKKVTKCLWQINMTREVSKNRKSQTLSTTNFRMLKPTTTTTCQTTTRNRWNKRDKTTTLSSGRSWSCKTCRLESLCQRSLSKEWWQIVTEGTWPRWGWPLTSRTTTTSPQRSLRKPLVAR